MSKSVSEQVLTVPGRPEQNGHWRSATVAVTVAVLLSAALLVGAIVDQTGGHRLSNHAAAMYAPYGKQPDPTLLYGLLYAVAAIEAVLWLVVLRAVRSRRRWAPAMAIVSVVISAALALILLATTEYGEQIFPPLWGVLAGLPAAAGIFATALLLRRR